MQHFKKILVSIDGDAVEHPELERAIRLATETGGTLHLVDVAPESSIGLRWLSEEYRHLPVAVIQEKQAFLEQLAEAPRKAGLTVSTELLLGRTSDKLIELAVRDRFDVVIRTTKGLTSLRVGFFGSTSLRLLKTCPVPLWLNTPQHRVPYGTILACVNAMPEDPMHDELNDQILTSAMELSEAEQGRLLVVHAWQLFGRESLEHRLPPQEFQRLRDFHLEENKSAFTALLAKHNLSIESGNCLMLEGDASLVIPRLAASEKVDLIAMGTVARTGVQGLLMGNTAERILQQVECSVLAFKPTKFLKQAAEVLAAAN